MAGIQMTIFLYTSADLNVQWHKPTGMRAVCATVNGKTIQVGPMRRSEALLAEDMVRLRREADIRDGKPVQ